MPNTFDVSVLSQDEIHSLTGDWDTEALRKVLALADADDIGEIAEEDLEDICLMSLQDIGNQRAGEIVLEAVFDDSMRPGVRQNLVDDLQEDQPWNDFAEVSKQRGIFVAVCLLHKAFPTRYGTPDATRLTIRVQAETSAGLTSIEPRKSAWLLRLLACGLSDDNIVHRLYGDELKQGEFTEASGLIWQAEMLEEPAEGALTRTITIVASSNLFNSLSAGQKFKAAV
tara:strand:- start:14347 stop:15027 length:681 start_codon:yes stop_codon:yes gene_type:complete